MNRYLAPAPAQFDLGQMRQVAAAQFGSVIDVNTVRNDDGTTSIAVYVESTGTAAKVSAWQQAVASTTYAPDSSDTNKATLLSRAAAALNTNVTYLGIATPTNAQVAAQVNALTKESSAIIRLLLGLFDSTSGA